jgi:hypothetical protein
MQQKLNLHNKKLNTQLSYIYKYSILSLTNNYIINVFYFDENDMQETPIV